MFAIFSIFFFFYPLDPFKWVQERSEKQQINWVWPNQKYIVPSRFSCKLNNLVYLFTCTRCGLQYVGETSRNLATRLSEHLHDIWHEANREQPTHIIHKGPTTVAWHVGRYWLTLLLRCPALDPPTEPTPTSTRWQCLNHPLWPHPLTVNCQLWCHMTTQSTIIKHWQHMDPTSCQYWPIVNATVWQVPWRGYNMAGSSVWEVV